MQNPISQSVTEVPIDQMFLDVSPELSFLLEQRLEQRLLGKPAKPSIPAQPLDPDDAAAQCLSLLTDPTARVLPGEALRLLTEQNTRLLDAPRGVIQQALSRQSVLLEAASIRFFSRAALAKRDDDACALLKMGLRTGDSLTKVLGILHDLTDSRTDGTAVLRHSVIPALPESSGVADA